MSIRISQLKYYSILVDQDRYDTYFVANIEGLNLHKTVWCEGGLQLEERITKNSREDELNHGLGYAMARLEN